MLVERDPELGLLRTAADRAATGRGSVVLVSGEAGIGKTSLVTEFLDGMPGTTVLWGACDDLATPRSFGPLHDIARGQPALAAALAEGTYVEVNEAFLTTLTAETGPVVGVIEDAHWADQATIDAIRYVGRRIGHERGLLVVTARTEALIGDHPLRPAMGGIPPGTVQRIELSPLSENGVAALAGSHAAPELFAATGGNPFFVTELLDSRLELPRGVVDSILARAANLSESTRDLLALVAVVPGETERSLITALHPDPVPVLADAEAAGLIRYTTTAARFRHELARRAYEAALTSRRRQAENRRVFSHLEDHDADPARLVHHAEEAGLLDGLARWAPVAGRRAVAAGAHREAVAHLQRATVLLERYPLAEQAALLESLAWELYVLGRFGVALAPVERAVAIRERLEDPVAMGNALRLKSRIHWIRGERGDAERCAEDAIVILEPQGQSTDLAFAYSTRSQLAMLAGEDEEAIRWGTVALDLGRRLDDPQILSHALNNVGTAQAHMSGAVEGLDLLEEARRVAMEHGLDDDVGRAWINQLWSLLWAHRYHEAGPMLEVAIRFAHNAQHENFEAYLVATRAMHRLATGDWDGAEADSRWVLEQAPGGAREFPASTTLATVLARRGDFAEARSVLERVWERALDVGELQRTGPVAVAIAEQAWLEGRPLDGLYALSHLDAEIIERGTAWERTEAAFWRRRSGLDHRVPDDAPEPYRHWFAGDFSAAAEAWHRIGEPYAAAEALGDSDEPEDLEEALTVMEGLGAAPAVGRITARLAGAQRRRRRLATVLFTDIVGSTELASRIGDAAWRALLDRHDVTTAAVVARNGGRVVSGTGDGVMASFTSPSDAIDAATALVDELATLGIEIRAGLHTGEVELRGDQMGGVAVHIAARVGAKAGTGQVLVSSTTRDLMVGGRRVFIDTGTHQLKGLSDEWRLYQVVT